MKQKMMGFSQKTIGIIDSNARNTKIHIDRIIQNDKDAETLIELTNTYF